VLAGVGGHRCNGRPQWHHPVKQQRIKGKFKHGARIIEGGPRGHARVLWEPATRHDPVVRSDRFSRTLRDILIDPRNRVWACWDAHQAIEGDHRHLAPAAWEFAREFGLDAGLENDIARQRGTENFRTFNPSADELAVEPDA
jgi:hypothetical protein